MKTKGPTYECPKNEPVCARCAGNHRTIECRHMGTPHCVNCQADGHSAADRDCPSFERSTEHFRRFTPDARYRYFPIEMDTRTWEPQDSLESFAQPVATEPGPPNWAKELEDIPSPASSPIPLQTQTEIKRPMTPRLDDMQTDLTAPPKAGSPQAMALSMIQSTISAWLKDPAKLQLQNLTGPSPAHL